MSLHGVAFIDHTADVGMDVEASSLEQLLHRSALGMLALLRGEDDEAASPAPGNGPGRGGAREDEPAGRSRARDAMEVLEPVPLSIQADGYAGVVAAWLSEILFLHEVRGMDYVEAELDRIGPDTLVGRVMVRPGGHAVREIKGVTYHELEAGESDGGEWRARVIFDV